MSAADIVASAREFADGLDVSLTEAGNARIHIARLADTIEQLITDLDARFEHSDHTAAKYYQRMRAAEREMPARELHHFEDEGYGPDEECRTPRENPYRKERANG